MQAAFCIKLDKNEILFAKYILNINIPNQTHRNSSDKDYK